MISVLVTGGAGYIGSHCCKELYHAGFNPITIDNLVQGHKENVQWGDFYHAEVSDLKNLEALSRKYTIDAVMHFAAYAYVSESMIDPKLYYENNLRNTIDLLRWVLEKSIRYFIFSSSCATYGNPIKVPIEEDHPRSPVNPYGRTKFMIEEILNDYHQAYGLKFVALRYFNAAGADPEGLVGEKHIPETHLIPLILDVAAGKSDQIQVFGTDYKTKDGTCIRDYIHVSDLAKAHVLALQNLMDGGPSNFINLGTGKGFSVLETIKLSEKVTGKKIRFESGKRRPGDPPVLVASNAKALLDLGWVPEFSNLEDIILTAWNWHKNL